MASKRARLSTSVEAESARAKLEVVAAELGHEIRVFLATSQTKHATLTTSNEDDADDFYDLTAEDYYNLMSSRAESQIMKTQKMREAEAVASRERLTKAVIRVRFPDDYILEAKFQPSETIQTLVNLLVKVVAQPNLPFYLFTTPPKQQIADLSKDFYSAGFAPGANVYFSYDVPESHGLYTNEPFLREDIRILSTLDLGQEQIDLKYVAPKPALLEAASVVVNAKPVVVRSTKPKWFRR
ncbi:plant UBX domain-containing protein 1-like [Musa acuminata AAA Group]|uniref:plant UBX domain-containing protein 1-like n=1 Tax=Musa acuminata AAA Group TaxID=214697 RepID=UPI0031CFE090